MSEDIIQTVKNIRHLSVQTGLDMKILDRIGSFFRRILTENTDTIVGLIGDALKYRQWNRQIRLIDKVETLTYEKGISEPFRSVDAKFILSVFLTASLESTDECHDSLARLLVSALNPESEKPRYRFVDIISQLEPADFKALGLVYDNYLFQKEKRRCLEKDRIEAMFQLRQTEGPFNTEALSIQAARMFLKTDAKLDKASPLTFLCRNQKIFDQSRLDKNVYDISIDSLIQLRLIATASGHPAHQALWLETNQLKNNGQTQPIIPDETDPLIGMTALGVLFVETCLP